MCSVLSAQSPSLLHSMSASPSSLRVLVVGASGGLGRHVLLQALAAGHTVTALVRNAAKLKEVLAADPEALKSVRIVEANAEDGAKVAEACKDQQALLVASHLVLLQVLPHALAAGITRISAAAGAPILDWPSDGRLAWAGLEEASKANGAAGRDYRTMGEQHWANYTALAFARGLQQYALACPGYMTDQPLLDDALVDSQANTFIAHCNAKPFPYANCAKIMVQALREDFPFKNQRVAMSVKKQ